MKNWIVIFALLLMGTQAVGEDIINTKDFGTIRIFRGTQKAGRLVLFLSGDAGWNSGELDKVTAVSHLNSIVVWIDINEYLTRVVATPASCSNAAKDFQRLGRFIKQQLRLPATLKPILFGYSSGATLVYAALVQSDPGTFAGAVSMGFCPDLVLHRSLCRLNRLQFKRYDINNEKDFVFEPFRLLEVPWLVLQGEADDICSDTLVDPFVLEVPNAEIVHLPQVTHGFRITSRWFPAFKKAFLRIFPV